MVDLSKHQFFLMVNEIFGTVINNYGFEIQEENNYLVIARKIDCELIFRLEGLDYSLAIKLSGELGQRATTDPYYRNRAIGVSSIAKCLDPTYRPHFKAAETEADLRNVLEEQKQELLEYCESILLGDVSVWQKVVECLDRMKREHSNKSC